MLFGLIATVMLSVNGFASNVDNFTILKQEITSISIDGKSYSPKEFRTLIPESLKTAAPCTVTTTVTVNIGGEDKTFTTTDTFEASWWVCLLAKAAAFLVSIWEPSVQL